MNLIPKNAVDALKVWGNGGSECRIGLFLSTSLP